MFSIRLEASGPFGEGPFAAPVGALPPISASEPSEAFAGESPARAVWGVVLVVATMTSRGSDVPVEPGLDSADWDVEDASAAGSPNSAVSLVEFDITTVLRTVRLITCGGNHGYLGCVN